MSTSKENILVTAVVTTYNRPEPVRRAIQSVLAQTYKPLEIIVVEDGSDSGIGVWLEEEELRQVRYVRHKNNKGLAAARNTGLKGAHGEYIAYLDDDDKWKPERIDRQMKLLLQLTPEERSRLAVIYCGNEMRFLDKSRITVRHPKNEGNLREAVIREGITTLSSTSLFSKAALQRVGGFDETLPSSIDHDVWMALATCGYEARTLDEPLVIIYDRRTRKAMMNNTVERIRGVKMFVEKWKATYKEWFGEAEGVAYGSRYFARVVGELAVDKLIAGNLWEAGQAIRAVFKYSETRYIFFVLLEHIKYKALFEAQRFLPRSIIDLLKAIKKKYGEAL